MEGTRDDVDKDLVVAGVLVENLSEKEIPAALASVVSEYLTNIKPHLHPHLKESHKDKHIAAYFDYDPETEKMSMLYGQLIHAHPSPGAKIIETRTIPKGAYVKFTSDPGPVKTVLKETWRAIPFKNPSVLGGIFNPEMMFEVYEEKPADLNNATVDVYVGIRPTEDDPTFITDHEVDIIPEIESSTGPTPEASN